MEQMFVCITVVAETSYIWMGDSHWIEITTQGTLRAWPARFYYRRITKPVMEPNKHFSVVLEQLNLRYLVVNVTARLPALHGSYNPAWRQNTFTKYFQLPSASTYVINGMECRGATNLQHSFAPFSLHSTTLSIIRRPIKHSNTHGKSSPITGLRCPEDSRKLRFPDYVTIAQNGGKVVSLKHRPFLPLENIPDTHFCQRLSRP